MTALLIDIGWKSALIAALVLAAFYALRGRAAVERVLLLRLGFGALLALPLLALAGPPLELAVLPAEEALSAAMPMAAEAGSGEGAMPVSEGLDLVLSIYWAGVALVLLRLAIGLLTLLRWTRAAVPSTDPLWTAALGRVAGQAGRRVRLRVSAQVDAPLSWGVMPAWILIGPDTEKQGRQAEAVLAHEMAHIRRFDWPMLLIAQLAMALLWFNPLVWWIGRALAGQTEVAADDAAVAQVAPLDYAQTLLAVGAGSAHRTACGMTYAPSTLGQRIRGVLDAGPRRPASRLFGVAMLVVAALIAGPLGAIRLVPAEAQPIADPVSEQRFQPAILPQAEARATQQTFEAPPRPQPRKRRKAPAPTPAKVEKVAKVEALPMSPSPSDPSRFVPPRGNHAIGGSGKREPWAGLPPEVRAKIVAAGKPPRPPRPAKGPMSLLGAAGSMRAKAQAMERVAADPAVPADVRAAYARTAGALHREAQQMERDAKRTPGPR
ncbi:MAG: M56 family metallopeptidase [Sphingomonadales bacterium]|nr:MAG: M56 family metallopeptidase [Sphingomonadales bacterium]